MGTAEGGCEGGREGRKGKSLCVCVCVCVFPYVTVVSVVGVFNLSLLRFYLFFS